jgi:hypothetical protein
MSDKKLLEWLLRLKLSVLVIFDRDLKRFLKCAISQSRLPVGFFTQFVGRTVFGGDLGCDKQGNERYKVVGVVAEVRAFCFCDS